MEIYCLLTDTNSLLDRLEGERNQCTREMTITEFKLPFVCRNTITEQLKYTQRVNSAIDLGSRFTPV